MNCVATSLLPKYILGDELGLCLVSVKVWQWDGNQRTMKEGIEYIYK